MALIDIGSPAITGATSGMTNITRINGNNPANLAGTITSVEVFAKTADITGAKVATFYSTGVNQFSTRAIAAIGTITQGSTQTFTGLSLACEIGDYIGIYGTAGQICLQTAGGVGGWYFSGDKIPCTAQAFSASADTILSVYATGTTPPAAPTSAHTDSKTDTQIVMHWTDNSANETGFKLYKDDIYIETIAADSVSYTYTGLTAGTQYDLAVKATNAGGDSAEAQLTEITFTSIVITIESIDKTSLVQQKQLSITDELNSRNTYDFEIVDTTGVYRPAVGQDVVVTKGAVIFAGTIDSIVEYSPNNNRTGALAFKINCVDYNQLCDRFLIAEAYEGHLAGDIVKHIIDDFINVTLPGEDVTYANVQDGPTISKAVFNYIYATQALDELAEISGFSWWIDYSKDMHFCSRLTNAAPFSLSDTSNNFRGFKVRHTRQDYRNKQYFRGGQDISSALTETFKGDGETATFSLTLPCAKVPTNINVDGGAALNVGIRQVETGKDWYWSEGDREITQESGAAKLSAANVLSVTYQGYFPIIVESFNESAIAERQAVEGGTGIYEHAVTDTSINTSDAVQERAEALVRKYGEIPETIEFETDSDGLKAGQLITVNLTKHAVNSAYLIQRVTIRDITANILRYQVTALSGENIGGWVDFFKKLAKAGQGYVIRENEVLLKIRKLSDNLTLTDTLSATSAGIESRVNFALVGYSEVG